MFSRTNALSAELGPANATCSVTTPESVGPCSVSIRIAPTPPVAAHEHPRGGRCEHDRPATPSLTFQRTTSGANHSRGGGRSRTIPIDGTAHVERPRQRPNACPRRHLGGAAPDCQELPRS